MALGEEIEQAVLIKNGSSYENVEQQHGRGNLTISFCEPQIYLFNLYLIFIIPPSIPLTQLIGVACRNKGVHKGHTRNPPTQMDE